MQEIEGYEDDPAYRKARKTDYAGAMKNLVIMVVLFGLFGFGSPASFETDLKQLESASEAS